MGDAKSPPPRDEPEGDIFAVRAKVTQGQALELAQRGDLDLGDRLRWSPDPDGTGRLDLFLSQSQIDELQAQGIEVQVESNQTERAREAQREIGQGDRFEGGRTPPRGLGRKIGGRETPREERPR